MEDRTMHNDYENSLGEDGGDNMKAAAGRWTTEEHHLFLQGLQLHNKQWKLIADLVKTRTVVQIRTHAQKYFQKLEKLNQGKRSDSIGGLLDVVVPMKTFPSALPPSRNNSISSADSLDAHNGGITSSEGESDSERSPKAVASEPSLNITFPMVLITKATEQLQEKKKAASPRKRTRDTKVAVESNHTALYRSKRANNRSCSDVSDATSLDVALSNDPFDDFLPFVEVDDDLDHSIYHLMEKIDWNAEEQQMIAASSSSHSSSPFLESTSTLTSSSASSLCAAVTAPIQSLRQLQDPRLAEMQMPPAPLGTYQPAPAPTSAPISTSASAVMSVSQPAFAAPPAPVLAPVALHVSQPPAAARPTPAPAAAAAISTVPASRVLPSVSAPPSTATAVATASPATARVATSARPVIAASTMEPRAVYSSVLDELKFLVNRCSSSSQGGQRDASSTYAPTQICQQLPSLRALSAMTSSGIKVSYAGYNYLTPLCSTFYHYPVEESTPYETAKAPAPAVPTIPVDRVPSSSSVAAMERSEVSSNAGACFVQPSTVTELSHAVHAVQQPLRMEVSSSMNSSLTSSVLVDSGYRISALDEKMDGDLLDSGFFDYSLGPSC